jgi:hypothetical protein
MPGIGWQRRNNALHHVEAGQRPAFFMTAGAANGAVGQISGCRRLGSPYKAGMNLIRTTALLFTLSAMPLAALADHDNGKGKGHAYGHDKHHGPEAARVVVRQPVVVKPAVVVRQPAVVVKPAVVVRQPAVVVKPAVVVRQPVVAVKPAAVVVRTPTVVATPPAVVVRPPAVVVRP